MAARKRWFAFPAAFAVYAASWWGITNLDGLMLDVSGWVWVLTYYPIFWGAWLAIPLLGAGATFLRPMLPERMRDPVLGLFIAWCLAWLGMLLAAWWLGPPPGFRSAPI